MIHYWLSKKEIEDRIFIPKYYDPTIASDLHSLELSHDLLLMSDLVEDGVLEFSTGHEIGKLAYGTGDVPFVRTSDISNWEIKTAPKQGVSRKIFRQYADRQDVRAGDILLVRDGTYLIGTNCIVTALDKELLYQSHILKIRVADSGRLDPNLLFLVLNSCIVQRQIRSFQFTADTIDTIGSRYLGLVLPIPKSVRVKGEMTKKIKKLLSVRQKGKAFIKQSSLLVENALLQNSVTPLSTFLQTNDQEMLGELAQDTITAEFGGFETFWHPSQSIKNRILLPKYYDPKIKDEIAKLSRTCDCISLGELSKNGVISCSTGDEIGKMAYGTGTIPFVRTSDFSNWEIKHDPKQGVSREIYDKYAKSQDAREGDILLVRDGTYLIGTSCIVTKFDDRLLYCGGIYKIRSLNRSYVDCWLLLALLNSYIVKRQIRTKQFTRDVIDTLGKRLSEVVIPIPKSRKLQCALSSAIKDVVESRISARHSITSLADEILSSK